jgi:glycosyltransferase involved in cell wall biosynthesis
MRLGLITTSLDEEFTGIGEYTYNIAKGLLDYAKENKDELTFIHRLKKELDIYKSNATELFVPYSKLGPIRYLRENYAIAKISQKFDVIHEPFIGLYKKLKCKMVVTIHDLTPLIFKNDAPKVYQYYFRYMMPSVLKNADRIIAVSQTTKKDIIRYYKVDENKISVIYNGVDKTEASIEDIESVKTKLKDWLGKGDEKDKLENDRFENEKFEFILFVGTPVMRKNIPNAIRAFSLLKKKGYKHKFVIAGRKGSAHSQILSAIKECNLENEVIFMGYMSKGEIRALYKLASLFVYPSIYEGFGLPPLEAMVQGTPVLVSNRSVMPESVGDAGLVVDPDDIKKMSEEMERGISDEKLREKLIEKGKEQIGKFDWKETAKRTYEIYKDL